MKERWDPTWFELTGERRMPRAGELFLTYDLPWDKDLRKWVKVQVVEEANEDELMFLHAQRIVRRISEYER